METRREHLLIDPEKCTACHGCTIACSMKHHGMINPDFARIKILYFKNLELNLPVVCMACEDPPCIKVCPVNARIRISNGTVITDTDTCIGCRTCIYICPDASPVINPCTGQTMTCDMCKDDETGPWCVTACHQQGALSVCKNDGAAMETMRRQAGRRRVGVS